MSKQMIKKNHELHEMTLAALDRISPEIRNHAVACAYEVDADDNEYIVVRLAYPDLPKDAPRVRSSEV